MFYSKEKGHWSSVALQDIYHKSDRYYELKSGKRSHLNTTLVGASINDRQYHFTVTKDSETTLLFKCDNQPLRFNIHFMSDDAVCKNIAALW